jgi:putative NADH-flavin reductase
VRTLTAERHLRLLVVGATGGTGQELVDQALARGHRVTALVRRVAPLRAPRAGLTLVEGDPLDPYAVGATLVGCDAVVSAIGPRSAGATTVVQSSARALVASMTPSGARRLLILSVGLLFPDAGVIGSVLRQTFLRGVTGDSEAMEAIVRASDLDWTIVRPPRLTSGPRTGCYAVTADRLPPASGGSTASLRRADLAHFLLDEVERAEYVRKVVGIAFTKEPFAQAR